MKELIIATRGSQLALWQANWVKSMLNAFYPDIKVEFNIIKTTGDKITDVPLAKVGGKGLFVKEIEEALLRGEAHIAVHSMKDVPSVLPDGLHLPVILQREEPFDAFVSRRVADGFEYGSFMQLPHKAIVGTSSLRRVCQLLHRRPDLDIRHLRGNLDTRLRKLDDGQFDAIVLAVAGLKRMGCPDRITERLPLDICLPAVGQGAIGIECRTDDLELNSLIKPFNHKQTSVCVLAERACLKTLEGGCQVPIAVHAETKDNVLILQGLVGSLKGDAIIKETLSGGANDPQGLGQRLAERLLAKGAGELLKQVYA